MIIKTVGTDNYEEIQMLPGVAYLSWVLVTPVVRRTCHQISATYIIHSQGTVPYLTLP